MLENYEHPILGLDLDKLESDLKLLHEEKWSKDKNLVENILATQGPEMVEEMKRKMSSYYGVLKTIVTALEESNLLIPEIPSA